MPGNVRKESGAKSKSVISIGSNGGTVFHIALLFSVILVTHHIIGEIILAGHKTFMKCSNNTSVKLSTSIDLEMIHTSMR